MRDARRRYAKNSKERPYAEVMRMDAIGLVACVDSVAAIEREACAQTAQLTACRVLPEHNLQGIEAVRLIVEAIRARGNK